METVDNIKKILTMYFLLIKKGGTDVEGEV